MAYKTILVLCDASEAAASRLAYAWRLACSSKAHLIALHLPPLFNAPTTLVGSLDMARQVRRHDEDVKSGIEKGRAMFGSVVQGSGPTSEWLSGSWSTKDDPIELARAADLVVMGQEASDSQLPRALPEAMIMGSGRPVMVVPLTSNTLTNPARALVCWDGTREAVLAASQALPLLQAVQSVDVLMIKPRGKAVVDQLGSRAVPMAWFVPHGVAARLKNQPCRSDDVGKDIIAYASDSGADLTVMGGYGHSPLRQALLGGVSRTVVEEAAVPVVMAH